MTDADRDKKPLKPFGEVGEADTRSILDQLERALRESRPAPAMAMARVQTTTEKDLADFVPAMENIARERLAEAKRLLARRREEEAHSLKSLLESQRTRITKASADAEKDDPNQFLLPGVLDEERREARPTGWRASTDWLARLPTSRRASAPPNHASVNNDTPPARQAEGRHGLFSLE